LNFSIRAMTQFRSMTDIHLVGRQNEGIWGIDPVRHGRVAAGEYVDSKSRKISKNTKAYWSYPVPSR
jgi:hypothetical protein